MSVPQRLPSPVGRPGNWRAWSAADAVAGASQAVLVAVAVGWVAASAAGVEPSLSARGWAYLALMVGVSLPHGGFEHTANLTGRGEGFRWRYLAAYVGLLGATLALFAAAPVAGLLAAVAITMLKGGHGGLHVLATRAGVDHLRARWQRALAVAVRGGAVMVVPFVVHPGVFSVVAGRMVAVFDATKAVAVGAAFAPPVRWAVGGAYAAAVVAHLAVGARRAAGGPLGNGGFRSDAAETLLLVAYFAVVPPILAVGVYFPCWYAARQVARLSAAGEAPRLGDVNLRTVARRFLRGAAPPWVGAVAVFGAVALVAPNPPVGPIGWVALYSVVIAAIAVPHVAVGSWLDRRQGIWSVVA